MSTHWRVRVVRSAVTIVLLCSQFCVLAQDLKSASITYSGNATLETVITQLSKQTGARFIYSSDKIKINSTISLSVKEQSLQEVLTQLGQTLNLQFKIQGNYITIKPLDKPIIKSTELVASRKPTPTFHKTALPAEGITKNMVRKFYAPTLPSTTELTSDYLERKLPELQSYFDASVLKQLPEREIRKLNVNNRHRGWFLSAGVLVNDYSKGFELQGGIRHAYVVFAPTWLPSGTFHGAFGLGSSIQLKRNFSINTVYTYSRLSETKTIYNNTDIGNHPPEFYKVSGTIHHQQLKAMLQWAPGKNIQLKLGPTFNYAKKTYSYEFPQKVMVVHTTPGYGEPPPPGSAQFHRVTVTGPIDPSSTENRTWLGWEASVSYKINFFKKP